MLKQVADWFGEKTVWVGDQIEIQFTNPNNFEKEVICTYVSKKTMVITEAKIYEFKDEFGLKEGFAAIIGNNLEVLNE